MSAACWHGAAWPACWRLRCSCHLILIGRVKWVEHIAGLDRLTRLHHAIGFTLIVLLVAHPVLVTAGHSMPEMMNPWAQLLDFWRTWPGLFTASIGLAIMIAALAFSVAIVWKRLRYEAWYAAHLTLYIALALAFWHQIKSGSDLTDNHWFRAYWYVLYAFAFGNLIAYRLVRPLASFARHRFSVLRLEPEAGDVTSVHIEGRHLDRFPVEAGQFMIVRFLAPGFRWEAHPFSMSCSATGGVPALGDSTGVGDPIVEA